MAVLAPEEPEQEGRAGSAVDGDGRVRLKGHAAAAVLGKGDGVLVTLVEVHRRGWGEQRVERGVVEGEVAMHGFGAAGELEAGRSSRGVEAALIKSIDGRS